MSKVRNGGNLTYNYRVAKVAPVTTTLSFDHLLPEGATAYDFQTVGVAYASVVRRTFIADEMGLGKTIQALLTLEATNSYPAVVVCPASLKGNWAREIKQWLPNRTVEVVSGRRIYDVKADILICNYDILSGWVDGLVIRKPQALILDESHYCKEIKAQRTKAAIKLAKAIPASGVVLLLTGTPLLNRPIELLAQLIILDKLAAIVGPTKNDDFEFGFKWNYCRNDESKANTGHYTWDSAHNLDQLNNRLRENCYIRRLRADVLDMNDTHRVPVILSLNGALKDYRRAEDNFLAFIRETKGDAAARKSAKGAHLAQLTTLIGLAEEAKLEAAIEWIDDFLASNPEKSLVVFAERISSQHALADHYGAPAIFGGQSPEVTEAAKKVFMDRQHRVIVCSLKAAREGHTLTAASDVLFVGQGWTPGGLQQAEDRVNRIGQEAAQVFAFKLLAEDTVEESVHAVIEAKREIFKAAADGDMEAEASSVQEEVLAQLYAKADKEN